ncbi:alpha/beta hydrolase family protein [Streptomyces albus]|nr:alpha/beta hydrolase family protein [Streptomyces albus]
MAFRVPGITNRLDNFQSFADGGVDLLVDGDGAERPDGAVISWLGYDTPEQGDSVDPAKAEVGGRELRAFRRGIGVSLRPDAKVGIFAHSYGTLVTSKALQEGMDDVDKVVFMGSPGLGPNIRSIKDFQMPNTRFFAMRAPGMRSLTHRDTDPIQRIFRTSPDSTRSRLSVIPITTTPRLRECTI